MKIAVLSGKGGTGKTFVSVNLAAAEENSCYADFDTEEPDGHLFFRPENIVSENVSVKIPDYNKKLCVSCQKCVKFCAFNALAYVGNKLMIFENVCHSCGGCMTVCPEHALTEKDKNVGVTEEGVSGGITVLTGFLNTGEASGVPIIKRLNEKLNKYKFSVIDCPPGSACQVLESVKNADYCVLVLEPTIFGLDNFLTVLKLVKLLNKKFGVIINKSLSDNNIAENYCNENGIDILARFPYDQYLAKINSEGLIAVREKAKYKDIFSGISKKIKEMFI